jgi:DNA mismatch repair protein MutS2
VHGASASGASLFLEPLTTVDINNDIVALEEQEMEEVRRILLALTDQFRDRPADLSRTMDVATELDVIQARARFSLKVEGVEPVLSTDGTLELRGARHPLLTQAAVPVDIRLTPPVRVLVIAGPNTGGKTVALKTAGLLAAMAQAGLHVPAEKGSQLPIFRSIFADIGDEQSISASLSTFSGHIAHLVAIERELALPALVLLDEVGAGTDPVEGAALGTAVIDHFRARGAHLVATTHYESLKTYAAATEGVVSAAFGFDPETFAPTYRLMYGSAGRSLAIEIAARLGMPASVISAARENRTEREKQLADHLARVDKDLSSLEQERRQVGRERMTVAETERKLRAREEALREREEKLRRRLDAKVDDQVREARREIDAVIEALKTRAAELSQQAAVRLKSGDKLRAAGLTTGDMGAVRSDARAALDAVLERLNKAGGAGEDVGRIPGGEDTSRTGPAEEIAPGVRVTVGTLGLEGIVIDVHGKHAEVDVRGKRLRAALRDLRAIGGPPNVRRAGSAVGGPAVHVSVDLQPREGSLSEINVIGSTVDEALGRLEKFLDEATLTDIRELRIVHGHGTGQLRRAVAEFL